MIEIMVLEDLKKIPQGLTLWGSVPHSQRQSLAQITRFVNQNLNDLHSLCYLNHHGNYSHLPIKSFQVPSSIDGSLVLVFLLEHDYLPDDLTPGTIIYRDEPHQSSKSNLEFEQANVSKI
jgi:hypothetical protein